MHIKTKDVYEDILDDFVKQFDTSNYEIERPLSKSKNKKVIKLMKNELDRNIVTDFFRT